MGKFYITLISLFIYFLSLENSWAQCPLPEQVSIQSTHIDSFKEGKGELTFTITSLVSFDRKSYRIRLWDESRQKFIYDDNYPSFLNITDLKVEGRIINFNKLPEGKYSLVLFGAGCEHALYPSYSSGPLSN